jgi:hypothetical protein
MNLRLVLAIAFWFAAPLAVEFSASQAVQAQVVGGNRYGIVTIHNKTQWTIKYSYRIGNGAWHQSSVEPGHHQCYWHEYAFANENRSPSFHIRFDSDKGPGAAWRQFHLKRNHAAWVNPEFGRHYDFKVEAGNQINLFAR